MIERQSLADEIKQVMVDRITSGILSPGDRLIELKIAEELGTSQAPVREALRELEAVGLVQFRRNRGAIVRKIEREELVQFYAVRAELEGFAAELAAGSDIGRALFELCDQMDAAVAQNDLPAFVDLNTTFHRRIVEAAGNGPLLEMWERLDIQTRTAVNRQDAVSDLAAAVADHRAIAGHIRSGDCQSERSALVAHVNGVVG